MSPLENKLSFKHQIQRQCPRCLENNDLKNNVLKVDRGEANYQVVKCALCLMICLADTLPCCTSLQVRVVPLDCFIKCVTCMFEGDFPVCMILGLVTVVFVVAVVDFNLLIIHRTTLYFDSHLGKSLTYNVFTNLIS